MSELDDKLRAIIADSKRDGDYELSEDDAIAQLKQAVADAGLTTFEWLKSEKYAKVDKLMYRDQEGRKFTQYTISYPDGSGEFASVPMFEFMTGQEWYDRFGKGLPARVAEINHTSVLDAARRAAGLTETEGKHENRDTNANGESK